jgi:SAM-dependent methyltransferase
MGDYNQYLWVKQYASLIKGPVLEIGSKFYDRKTSVDYRDICKGLPYVGTDLFPGENVDVVMDFTDPYADIEQKLRTQFSTIICCSVMEHVKDIFTFAKNVQQVLKPGGVIFLSSPFAWEYHGYPHDYWRFTPRSFEYLFPEIDFVKERRSISSNIDHDIAGLEEDEDVNKFVLREKLYWTKESSTYGSFRLFKKTSLLLRDKAFRKEFLIRKLLGKEYRLSLASINMVGIKK